MVRLYHQIFVVTMALLIMLGSTSCGVTMAQKTADGKWALVPLADGFDYPVGKPNGEGYYKARGLRQEDAAPLGRGLEWRGRWQFR